MYIRKVSLGDNPIDPNTMHYVQGNPQGRYTIHTIWENENKEIEIYVYEGQDKGTLKLWKKIQATVPVTIEYFI